MTNVLQYLPTKAAVKFLRSQGFFQLDGHAHTYFSQMGEDVILMNIFENKKKGFYVDVGAYHPKQYSNTYLFYLRNWRGINIDAMPGSMEVFNRFRPRDINLEIAIGLFKKKRLFHVFDQKALSSFSSELSAQQEKKTEYRAQKKIALEVHTLEEVLNTYLPANQSIDFLSVDVEGLDYDVLASNNWRKFRPTAVVVEDLHFSLDQPGESRVYSFLRKQKYQLVGKTSVSLIFITE